MSKTTLIEDKTEGFRTEFAVDIILNKNDNANQALINELSKLANKICQEHGNSYAWLDDLAAIIENK